MDEVYFCGKCNRQYGTDQRETCKVCGKTMVSWFLNKEPVEVAKRRWKQINRL